MAAGSNRKAVRSGEAKFSYTANEVIEDAAKLYVGEMIERVDSTDEVRPATAVSGTFIMGVGTKEVDNTDDGETVDFIETSVLGLDNDGSITLDSLGELAYVSDAATVSVSATAGATTNIAGRISNVLADNTVMVDFDPAKKN